METEDSESMTHRKEFELSTREEILAFIMFLRMERDRHKEDIDAISKDIRTLMQKYNIRIAEIPDKGDWVKVD